MKKLKDFINKYKLSIVVAAVIIVTGLGYAGYVFAVSPGAIRNPQLEHAHIRMQLMVDGQEVNFGEDKFQESYEKGQCSANLSETPVHFHDNKNQFVHLHWKDISGGLVLKYYGWNMIGGADDILGYRLDTLPQIQRVKTFGSVLPDFPEDAKLWVYAGDETSYHERSAEEFLNQDFETFFGVESTVNSREVSLLDLLFPTALAHGNDHANENMSDEEHAEMLARVQNLLGNVVIFAQKDQPSDQQIMARFDELEPLGDSVCGG